MDKENLHPRELLDVARQQHDQLAQLLLKLSHEDNGYIKLISNANNRVTFTVGSEKFVSVLEINSETTPVQSPHFKFKLYRITISSNNHGTQAAKEIPELMAVGDIEKNMTFAEEENPGGAIRHTSVIHNYPVGFIRMLLRFLLLDIGI